MKRPQKCAPLVPHRCGFESPQRLWILSCKQAIQLAYIYSSARSCLNNARKGTWGRPQPVKLGPILCRCDVKTQTKINSNVHKWQLGQYFTLSWVSNKIKEQFQYKFPGNVQKICDFSIFIVHSAIAWTLCKGGRYSQSVSCKNWVIRVQKGKIEVKML
jgi:hypothetical protein